MDNPISNRTYYPSLDGLRGIAILSVVLFHCFRFLPLFEYGWLGVDLFFVLSGFLITEILIETRETHGYFKNFYMRRVLRIFPLYYLSLILVIIVLPAIKAFPFDLSYYKEHQLWHWFYLENWLLTMERWKNGPYILSHFWSLAVEEQFYLVWPLIIFFVKNPKHLFGLCVSALIFVILSRIYILSNRDLFPLYQNIFLFTRIDGILAGAMLALQRKNNFSFLKRHYYLIILSVIGINIIVYILRKSTFDLPYWGIAGYPTFALFFALLIKNAINPKNKFLNLILNTPPLKFLGKISYGLYIFHWPVFLLLYKYIEKWIVNILELNGLTLKLSVSLLLSFISFFLSIISYYTFERIWLKLKDRYR